MRGAAGLFGVDDLQAVAAFEGTFLYFNYGVGQGDALEGTVVAEGVGTDVADRVFFPVVENGGREFDMRLAGIHTDEFQLVAEDYLEKEMAVRAVHLDIFARANLVAVAAVGVGGVFPAFDGGAGDDLLVLAVDVFDRAVGREADDTEPAGAHTELFIHPLDFALVAEEDMGTDNLSLFKPSVVVQRKAVADDVETTLAVAQEHVGTHEVEELGDVEVFAVVDQDFVGEGLHLLVGEGVPVVGVDGAFAADEVLESVVQLYFQTVGEDDAGGGGFVVVVEDGQLVLNLIAVAAVDGHAEVFGAADKHVGAFVQFAHQEFFLFVLRVEQFAGGEDGNGAALDLGMPLFGVVEILRVAEGIFVPAQMGDEVEVGAVEGGALDGEDVGKGKLVGVPEGFAVAYEYAAVVAFAEGLEEVAAETVGLDAVEVGEGEQLSLADKVAGRVAGDFGGVEDVEVELDIVGLQAQAHNGLMPLGKEGMAVEEDVVGAVPEDFGHLRREAVFVVVVVESDGAVVDVEAVPYSVVEALEGQRLTFGVDGGDFFIPVVEQLGTVGVGEVVEAVVFNQVHNSTFR